MDELAGIGNITQSVSDFDNAKIIELSNSRNYNSKTFGPSTMFAAKWTSNNPESIILYMVYNGSVSSGDAYETFTGMKVNIDGEFRSFETARSTALSSGSYNTVTKTIYTKSSAPVIIPISYLKKMIAGESVKIRVLMIDTYEDIIFDVSSDSYGNTYSKVKLKELLEVINNDS